jgi:hypothetical protein
MMHSPHSRAVGAGSGMVNAWRAISTETTCAHLYEIDICRSLGPNWHSSHSAQSAKNLSQSVTGKNATNTTLFRRGPDQARLGGALSILWRSRVLTLTDSRSSLPLSRCFAPPSPSSSPLYSHSVDPAPSQGSTTKKYIGVDESNGRVPNQIRNLRTVSLAIFFDPSFVFPLL